MALALVATSVKLTPLITEAAQPADESLTTAVIGLDVSYNATDKAINVVWGNDQVYGSYCVTITGKDTGGGYSKTYTGQALGAHSYPDEYEAGKTYTVEVQGEAEGKYSAATSKDITIPGGDAPVVKPSAPSGLDCNYWSTEDVNKGKIWIVWGSGFGTGGTPTSWKVYIDDKLVGTENTVAAYFYDNIYTAGTHFVKLVAVNDAGESDPTTGSFTLSAEQAGFTGGGSGEVDKTALNAEIATAQAVDTTLYTESTVGTFTAALTAAQTVAEKADATQTEVDGALGTLQEAREALVLLEDPGAEDSDSDVIVASDIGFTSLTGAGDSGSAGIWNYWTNGGITAAGAPNSTVTFTFPSGRTSDDWTLQLQTEENISLEAGAYYTLTFAVESSIPRMIEVCMGDTENNYARYNDVKYTVPGGVETTVSYVFAAESAAESKIQFLLGTQPADDSPFWTQDGGHTLKISNISLVKKGSAGTAGANNAAASDRTALDALVAECEALDTAEYTSATADALKAAIAAAKVAALQKDVDEKLAALQIAKANLVAAPISADNNIVVSEQITQVKVGNAITLNYTADSDTFAFGTYEVKVNGTAIDNSLVTIDTTAKTITLAASLFNAAGVYKIQISQDECYFSPVYQTVYAADTKDNWRLIWNDEFSGTALDTSKWDYQTGDGGAYNVSGWGNDELEIYTRSPENLSVGDGKLTITAKKSGDGYTSARIRTVTEHIVDGKADKGTALQAEAFGKIEAKIRMPIGDGIWPAFWMLPYDSEYGTWATSGELDIMEARGRFPQEALGTIHYGDVWPNNSSIGGTYKFEGTENIGGYHVYGVEWDPDEIRWYVDGECYYKANNWYSVAGEDGNYPFPAPFDEEFYILFNLALGGVFDGGVQPTTVDENGVSMDVDYVRWYQRTEGYDNWVIEEKEAEKDTGATVDELLAMADADGNFIKDANFVNISTAPITNGADLQVGVYEKWTAMLIPSNGNGSATWSKVDKDGTNYLKVSVTDAGSQTYSSQMVQYFPVVKGYSYEISYKAYTDADKAKGDVSLKIGGDDDNGWAVYSGNYTDDLTTSPKEYKHRFTMMADTDPTARFEFNLATSEGNVYLSDVSVKVIEMTESTGEDDPKEALSDGNQIYNGKFQVGSDNLLYWHWTNNDDPALVYGVRNAENNRVAQVKAGATPVSLWQYGINLLQKDDYTLSFDVDSSAAQDITVAVSNKDGSVEYYKETAAVNAGEGKVSVDFTQPVGKTDEDAKVTITFAKDAQIDNVSLVRTTNNNVNFDEVSIWPLYNGDFFNGEDGWIIWHDGAGWETHEVTGGVATMNASIGTQPTFYAVGFRSKAMTLTKGLKYKVKFDYEVDKDINATLEFAGKSTEIVLQAGKHTYVSDMHLGAGNCTFALEPGLNEGKSFTVKLSNVEAYLDPDYLEVPAGYAKPASLTQNAKTPAGQATVVKYSDNAAWGSAAKEYYLDDALLDASKVTVNAANNTITLDGSCVPAQGQYSFKVKAEGFTMTYPITLSILDADASIVQNGDFSYGKTPWKFYMADWENAAGGSYTVEDDVAVVEHIWDSGEGWHFRLYQEGIEYEAGSYVLSFDAYATVERPIQVQLEDPALVNTQFFPVLTTEKQTYSYLLKDLAESKAGGVTLWFWLGSNITAPSGEKSPNDNHTIYIDNVVIRPATADDLNTEPATIASAGAVKLGKDVTINYTDASANWLAANKTVYVDDAAVAASKIKSATDTGIVIDGSVFAKVGKYSIRIVAEGYDTTNTVAQSVQDPSGELIINGSLDSTDNWVVWDRNTAETAGQIADGVYTQDYTQGSNADGYWMSWTSQLKQEGIALEAGKTYELIFDADLVWDAESGLDGEREINIEFASGVIKPVTIKEGAGSYVVEFTPSATGDNYYVNFMTGAAGEKLQTTDPRPHTLTLDNISLKEKIDCDHSGETEVRGAVDPTCMKEGYTGDVYCKTCDTRLSTGTVIEKLDHKFTNYVYNNDATTEKDGTETAECDYDCGTTDTRTKAGTKLAPSEEPENPENPTPGEIQTKIDVDAEGATVSVADLTEDAIKGMLTVTELLQVANGATVSLIVEAEDIDKTVSAADKESILKAAEDSRIKDLKIGMYMDLSLFKEINDNGVKKVTQIFEPATPLKISIAVPDSLKNTNSNVERTYYVIRLHEGVASVLNASYNASTGMVTFETDKFSTYALAYTDNVKAGESNNNNNNNNSNSNNTTPAASTEATNVNKSPRTEDSAMPVWLWMCIFLAGVGLVGYSVSMIRRQKQNEK